jgi:hypothetical protein
MVRQIHRESRGDGGSESSETDGNSDSASVTKRTAAAVGAQATAMRGETHKSANTHRANEPYNVANEPQEGNPRFSGATIAGATVVLFVAAALSYVLGQNRQHEGEHTLGLEMTGRG